MSEQRFAFHHDPRFALPLRLLGVRPATCWVALDGEELAVRFGPWRLRTPVSNLAGVCRTGPYHWFKAIGARGSFADRGATFGTSPRGGVCITFHEPVGALLGEGRFRHPGLTVTVADPEALVAAVRARTEGADRDDEGQER
jgi:hypothetical protein